jgi:uncharacterized membrane protein
MKYKKANHKKNLHQKFYDRKRTLMEIVPLGFLLLMILTSALAYNWLPEKVPIHWNARGEIDNYGSKEVLLFLIPGMFFLFWIMSIILPAMDVYRDNILMSYKYYYATKIVISSFFLVIYITLLASAAGYVLDVARITIVLIAGLFVAIGFLIRNIRRNFFVGIRLPWTLADDTVWKDVHDIGGKIFIGIGLLMIAALIFMRTEIIYAGFLILIIINILYLSIYSYIKYKKVILKK